ncbi:hypothetical protein PYJP_12960 [Pyrofollis japonicus]|uniref:hypothetical protein n=1 Tax=Pyrofollis japonicus TaxID=3060460 RepID=UPI00295BC6FC|nr:hypothetical protein [Pyrofollis japonicus]BEP17944.1 hypothetical protein PYJP_12960 [Pyrofollis japonicus]
MMPKRLAAFDVEATCIRGPSCKIVSAALVEIRGDELVLDSIRCAVEPPSVSVGRTALVHGITGANATRLGSLSSLLAEAATYTLVTYGDHDAALLLQEAERRGLPINKVCFIDVLSYLLSNPSRRYQAMRRGGYPLEEAIREILGISPPETRFHDPIVDAVYVGLLYIKLRKRGDEPKTTCITKRRSLFSVITGFFRGKKH